MRLVLAICLLVAGTTPTSAQTTSCATRFYWDANAETDLAGYVLSWGAVSGVYTTSSAAIPKEAVTYEVPLPSGVYYVALRAFNAAGLHSGYSNEVRVVVDCTSGARRPPVKISGVVVFVIR